MLPRIHGVYNGQCPVPRLNVRQSYIYLLPAWLQLSSPNYMAEPCGCYTVPAVVSSDHPQVLACVCTQLLNNYR